MSAPAAADRAAGLRHALALEYATIAWMIVEAGVSIYAGIAARSVSMTAFGLDSVVEIMSAGALLWRLRWEAGHECADDEDEHHHARIELATSRVVAVLLGVLCVYVVAQAAVKLLHGESEGFSALGLLVTALAIPIMIGLSASKRRLADRLGSGALRADAAQGVACWYLAVVVIVGMLAQRLLGLWWIDGVASLAIVFFLAREAREAWEGRGCC